MQVTWQAGAHAAKIDEWAVQLAKHIKQYLALRAVTVSGLEVANAGW